MRKIDSWLVSYPVISALVGTVLADQLQMHAGKNSMYSSLIFFHGKPSLAEGQQSLSGQTLSAYPIVSNLIHSIVYPFQLFDRCLYDVCTDSVLNMALLVQTPYRHRTDTYNRQTKNLE